MKRKNNIDDLRWVRLFTSSHIPKYLIEQIAKRDFEVDAFFHHLESQILDHSTEIPQLNPLFHVWSLVDKENLVKGCLWFTIDPLTQDMIIQVYSVDSNYWGKGAVEKLSTHMKFLRKKAKLKKIYWITHVPKHSEKYGFKPSQNVLMEYNEEEEIKDGKNSDGESRDHGSPSPRTISVSEECL